MTVKELIAELLDMNMDAEVSILIETPEGSIDETDFKINESYSENFVELTHEAKHKVIIDRSDHQELIEIKDMFEEWEESQ